MKVRQRIRMMLRSLKYIRAFSFKLILHASYLFLLFLPENALTHVTLYIFLLIVLIDLFND